jgi:hypothetical protein
VRLGGRPFVTLTPFEARYLADNLAPTGGDEIQTADNLHFFQRKGAEAPRRKEET